MRGGEGLLDFTGCGCVVDAERLSPLTLNPEDEALEVMFTCSDTRPCFPESYTHKRGHKTLMGGM